MKTQSRNHPYLLILIVMTLAGYASSLCAARIAVPSYFYPGPYWTQLEGGAPVVGLAVINPNSGPGSSFDQNYSNEVATARAQGIVVLGYVYSGYGKRSLRTVLKDIDKHVLWYKVDGIFVDEASNRCSNAPYYQRIYDYVKSKRTTATVVINPGGVTQECYVNTADIILNFEDVYSAYVNWKPMGWEQNYPAEKFWHLIHNTKLNDVSNAVSLAKARSAGWIFVTPDTLPNPWDTLPPDDYWMKELKLIDGD